MEEDEEEEEEDEEWEAEGCCCLSTFCRLVVSVWRPTSRSSMYSLLWVQREGERGGADAGTAGRERTAVGKGSSRSRRGDSVKGTERRRDLRGVALELSPPLPRMGVSSDALMLAGATMKRGSGGVEQCTGQQQLSASGSSSSSSHTRRAGSSSLSLPQKCTDQCTQADEQVSPRVLVLCCAVLCCAELCCAEREVGRGEVSLRRSERSLTPHRAQQPHHSAGDTAQDLPQPTAALSAHQRCVHLTSLQVLACRT